MKSGFHLGISSWGGSSQITWPYGHGEGRIGYLGGKLGQFGEKLSCLGGEGASPALPSLDETLPMDTLQNRFTCSREKN